jgi:hypothetical protein
MLRFLRTGFWKAEAISKLNYRDEAARCRVRVLEAADARSRAQLVTLADLYDREAETQELCGRFTLSTSCASMTRSG